ncbi:hypothetical protein VCHENC03_1816 [Vibrio sp. HENC-03]|nr:hypothetical protein VCHENC03_1816 [Vibrio sp. HENC-03]
MGIKECEYLCASFEQIINAQNRILTFQIILLFESGKILH